LPQASSDVAIRPIRHGLHVMIRLSPRAKSDRVIGLVATAGGGCALKAAVTAPAQNGQANEALLRLLANVWRLPRRDLSIVAGAASRNKIVRVAGDPQRLSAHLSAELAGLPGLDIAV
jgi:uncharacterized protein (TIGR00251 family)